MFLYAMGWIGPLEIKLPLVDTSKVTPTSRVSVVEAHSRQERKKNLVQDIK